MGKNDKYYWNGEPCKIRVVYVLLEHSGEPEAGKCMWWKPFEGTIRQAIEVQSWGAPFLIDNEDGLGYSKVTVGLGSFQHGHRSYGETQIVCEVKPEEWITRFSQDKYDETEAISDAYWRQRNPAAFERLERLKKMCNEFK